MTIHVSLDEAARRLAELAAAAARGEEVVFEAEDGVRIQLVAAATEEAPEVDRSQAFGMYAHLIADDSMLDIAPSMTDAEYDARLVRKFGPPA